MKQIIPTMKTFTNLCCLLTLLCSISYVTAQTTQVKITVDWEDVSYLNKVEVYNPANYKILDICNTNVTTDAVNQCYNASGTDLIFTGTYNLGCIANATGYYVKLFNINGSAWSNGTISINVDGVEVVNNNGSLADTSGYTIAFDVEDKDATDQCTPLPDSDNDGVIDLIDLDDDNDGILDIDEGLGIDSFNCTIPALNFYDGAYDSLASTGDEGEEGAVYRFPNAVFGENYDVLVEIVEMHDATLTSSGIDIDTVDNPNYLQTRIEFTGNDNPVTGTDYPGDPNPTTGLDYPGIIFKFTIVDNTIPNNTTPTTNLIRIGGTTWDVDGTTERRESVRYYNPSAYGVDNPTTLQVTDINGDASEIEMTAGGILEGPGFSTLTQLRSYFQFLSSEFTLRMQNVRTDYTGSNVREYSMSFTQCDVLDFKSSSIIITQGEDTDGDGISNDKDIDSDNDGIPDNVEAQSTTGYSIPDGSVNPVTGIDTAYGDGLILEDTDGDEIFDFLDTDSDNDGTLDVDENGDPDPLSGIDTPDADGLDNSFDDVPTLSDVNDEITTGTLAELTTSFLDSDGDIPLGGDLDYRDAIDVYYDSATIDFDGENDYVDSEQILGGLPNASIMAWILLKDNTFTSESFIIGQDNFNLRVQRSDNVLVAQVNTNTFTLPISTAFDLNKWAHVAAVYQGGIFKVYINGEEQLNETLTGALNASLDNFTIGKNPNGSQLFKGAIDEVRVFNVALSEDQLQQIVFQEIEQNGANVRGTIVPLDIADFTPTASTLLWGNLQMYYPMSQIANTRTLDFSGNNRHAMLYNITTIQPQTAPMPYETKPGGDGLWTNTDNWLNGNVWDIQNTMDVKPWAIFQIHDDMEVSSSVKSYGLFIDDNKTLKVTGDNEINNSWYLQLDGIIDLEDDSQLVQGEFSNLITGSEGQLLRRQEGNLNYFWYNYWSSPVGATAETNNTNTDFRINMLQDGGGIPVSFTSSYSQAGKISTRWLYKFQNGQTYYDWVPLSPTSIIQPGVGYTQKGISNANGDQQYIFKGKPNNGTIILPADDIDNDSDNEHLSEPGNYFYTSTLIGNPYPSTISAKEFIKDNGPLDPENPDGSEIISGTVYIWEQWAGTSHTLNEYEGGYGTINYSATAPAYQWNDPLSGADPLAKTPTFYIPVGQGFFVEVVADSGDIIFKNSQRIFKTEAEGDGPIFFRNGETSTSEDEDTIGTIRLQLNVSNGNSRNFVLAFSDAATDGFDYGYDARTIDPQQDDLNSFIDDKKMIIQTFAPITDDKVVDLVFNSTGTYDYTLEIIELENIAEDQDIYLRDNLTNTYYDLRSGEYSFSSEVSAEDTERFDIVFQSGDTLDTEDFTNDNTIIFVNNTEDMLYVKGLTKQAKQMSITNMLGQNIRSYNNLDNQTLENGVNISSLSTGVYLVNLNLENGTQLSKKIILD